MWMRFDIVEKIGLTPNLCIDLIGSEKYMTGLIHVETQPCQFYVWVSLCWHLHITGTVYPW